MNKLLIALGVTGLGIALVLTLLLAFLVWNQPGKGVKAEPATTAITLPGRPSTFTGPSGTPPVEATATILPPQPTPEDTLGGGTVFDGYFVFDLRLFRDHRFGRNPVAPSLYSDMEGIGAWMYWHYTGAEVTGPMETYWGRLPQFDPLLQEAYDSIQLGSSGGRSGGVLLPGGFYAPGNSKPGDHIQLALKVVTPQGAYGGMLAFTLAQGANGFEPVDISVDVLGVESGK